MKDKSLLTPEQRRKLNCDVDRLANLYPPRMLALCYLRHEKLRLLNPRQFSELYARNLAGEGTFDDLVDQLEGPK